MSELVQVDWGGDSNAHWPSYMLDMFQLKSDEFHATYVSNHCERTALGFGIPRLPSDLTDSDYICRALKFSLESLQLRSIVPFVHTLDLVNKTVSRRLHQDTRTLHVFTAKLGWEMIRSFPPYHGIFPKEILFACLEFSNANQGEYTRTYERNELFPLVVSACGHNVADWKRFIRAIPTRFQHVGITFDKLEDQEKENSYLSILIWMMECAPPGVMTAILSDVKYVTDVMCEHPHHHGLFPFLPNEIKKKVWEPILRQYQSLFREFEYKNVLSPLTYAQIFVECGATLTGRIWRWHVDQELFSYALSQSAHALKYMSYNGLAKIYHVDAYAENIEPDSFDGVFCDHIGEMFFTDCSVEEKTLSALCVFRRVAELVEHHDNFIAVLVDYCSPLIEFISNKIDTIPKVHFLQESDFAHNELGHRARDSLRWMVSSGIVDICQQQRWSHKKQKREKKNPLSKAVQQQLANNEPFWHSIRNPNESSNKYKETMLQSLALLVESNRRTYQVLYGLPCRKNGLSLDDSISFSWQSRMILDYLLEDYTGGIQEIIVQAMAHVQFRCTRERTLCNCDIMRMQIVSTPSMAERVDMFNCSGLRNDIGFIIYAFQNIDGSHWEELEVQTIFPLGTVFRMRLCKQATFENWIKEEQSILIWWCGLCKKISLVR